MHGRAGGGWLHLGVSERASVWAVEAVVCVI